MKENLIYIPVKKGTLEGDLQIPPAAKGIVLFAHGSGSSRHSPRNRFVAELLRKGGLATLLIDLLTKEEGEADEFTAALRFDIDLLTNRLSSRDKMAAKHLKRVNNYRSVYFGASTGAAAALCAAAEVKEGIAAVVSRGGRPDLAKSGLERVKAPTLLIVGGHDGPVIGMNEEAYAQLHCEKNGDRSWGYSSL